MTKRVLSGEIPMSIYDTAAHLVDAKNVTWTEFVLYTLNRHVAASLPSQFPERLPAEGNIPAAPTKAPKRRRGIEATRRLSIYVTPEQEQAISKMVDRLNAGSRSALITEALRLEIAESTAPPEIREPVLDRTSLSTSVQELAEAAEVSPSPRGRTSSGPRLRVSVPESVYEAVETEATRAEISKLAFVIAAINKQADHLKATSSRVNLPAVLAIPMPTTLAAKSKCSEPMRKLSFRITAEQDQALNELARTCNTGSVSALVISALRNEL